MPGGLARHSVSQPDTRKRRGGGGFWQTSPQRPFAPNPGAGSFVERLAIDADLSGVPRLHPASQCLPTEGITESQSSFDPDWTWHVHNNCPVEPLGASSFHFQKAPIAPPERRAQRRATAIPDSEPRLKASFFPSSFAQSLCPASTEPETFCRTSRISCSD